MGLLQRFYCLFGKHHRSRGRAWSDGGHYRSWCTGCGRPMTRSIHGWTIDAAPTPRADDDNME